MWCRADSSQSSRPKPVVAPGRRASRPSCGVAASRPYADCRMWRSRATESRATPAATWSALVFSTPLMSGLLPSCRSNAAK